MKLHSNIGSVIQRLKRLQAGLPEAAVAAVDPAYWRGRLEYVALKTLRAQWALERNLKTRETYERMTPMILSTLTSQLTGRVAEFSLSYPGSLATALSIAAAVDYNLGQKTPAGREKKFAFQEPDKEKNLQATRDAIREWVELEKRRDTRDVHADGSPLTNDELVRRIEEILGVSQRAVPRARSPEMEEAAKSLTGAIEGWLAGEGDAPPVNRPSGGQMSAATVNQWLTAVLLAWRAYVQTHLRDRIDLQLTKLHGRIASELI